MKQNPFYPHIIRSHKTDIINISVLIATWVIMVILVNPVGDFPLNDDWAYGYSVKYLIENGDLQFLGWTATNLISQVFWGALFCLPFGFSFTALRFSTLTLGLTGVLATYGLLREVDENRNFSLLGAMMIAINPIYFGLSNTFMNDVPFFGFAAVSFYFLLRGLKSGSELEILTGIFIAWIALLSRQVGMAILLAFGYAYLAKKGTNLRNFIKGFSPALAGIAIQLSYQKWLQLTMRLPDKYGNQIKTLLEELSRGAGHALSNFTKIGLFSLIYLGLFLFPILIISFTGKSRELSSRYRIMTLTAVSGLFAAIIMTLVLKQRRMPLVGNILADFGVGPLILKNSYLPQAPQLFWTIITTIGAIGAAILLLYLFFALAQIFTRHSSPESEKTWLTVFIVSTIGIYFLPVSLLGLGPFGFYDRYLIFLLPLLLMIVSISAKDIKWDLSRKSISVALLMMLLCGGFTIGATHDYLSWNRVRWQGLHYLMRADRIPPSRIDGGFEFNGWYLYDPGYDDWKYEPEKSWYWVDRDDYIISFEPLAGYRELKRYTFRRWFPWGQGKILVLKRSAG